VLSSRLFVPFIEPRQSRFSVIIRGSGIFRMVNEHRLQLKVTSCLNKRVSYSLEALEPGIDFSSLAMKALNDVFFVYIESLLFSKANLHQFS
jgi:hypothetical protein